MTWRQSRRPTASSTSRLSDDLTPARSGLSIRQGDQMRRADAHLSVGLPFGDQQRDNRVGRPLAP
jgi:hypothetical protein